MTKGHADYYAQGDWNAVCYTCGGKFKATELRKQWQGYFTCKDCWEPRHPQDFVKGVADNMAVPWAQPTPAYTFTTFGTLQAASAWADLAVADYSVCDRLLQSALPTTY